MDASGAIDPLQLDLQVVFERLRAAKATDAWLATWLPATYAAPEAFRRVLYAFASRRAPIRSRAEGPYDFHRDGIGAHTGRKAPAFVELGTAGRRELSYDALHDRSSALAMAWQRAGVRPGQCVCIVQHLGIDWLVAIGAALRLGCVLSVQPPAGRLLLHRELRRLAPDWVAVGEAHRSVCAGWCPDPKWLPLQATDPASGGGSYAYAADEVVLRALSPLTDDDKGPFDVTAAALHEALLRDAFLVFALDGSDVLAAPGFDVVQFQPHLALCALVVGATYVEVPLRDLHRDPALLARTGATMLGVGRFVRELLLARAAGEVLTAGQAWFRSLGDALDFERWNELVRVLGERKVVSFDVMANAASGGCHLFSARHASPSATHVWPAPGREWQLTLVAAPDVPALDEAGSYTALVKKVADESLSPCLIHRNGHAYAFAGTLRVAPDSRTYPCDVVAAAAERHPAVRYAAVVQVPGKWPNDARSILLAFNDAVRSSSGALEPVADPSEIRALVARDVGEAWLPDRVEVFPLRPRVRDGRIDVAWCRSQYLSGALTQKARSDLFVMLSRLRYIFDGAAKAPR